MVFLIVNCYDWVGFHIVNKFLESGYDVDGYDELANKDHHLSMFLGRNSSFHFVQDITSKNYRTSIIVDMEVPLHTIHSQQIIRITQQVDQMERSDIVTIKKPMLFGEWMPMDERGVYFNNEHISFQSQQFKKHAIHINDFTDVLLQWVESSKIPEMVNNDPTSDRSKICLLESSILQNNKSIEKRVTELIAHYKRNKHFYSL